MRLIVGCEYSGRVRDAFIAAGHEAISCDFLPTDVPGPHLQMDVLESIRSHGPWDMGIFFPTCTYLCGSRMHWTTRGLRDPKLTEDALDFVRSLLNCGIPKIALENPVGVISTRIRKPDQSLQPHDFGDDASKRTCLWLQGLPKLVPTLRIPGRKVILPTGKVVERWANQTDSGQNRLGPSDTRWKERSETYPGIARAMALTWG